METLGFLLAHFGLFGAVLSFTLYWAVKAHRSWFFVFSMEFPGFMQVGLEVGAISMVGFVFPWAVFNDAQHMGGWIAATFYTVIVLSFVAGAAWAGIRAASHGAGYAVAQGMIASLFYFVPILVLGAIRDLTRLTPPGEGGIYEFVGTLLVMGYVGLLFPLIALGTGVVTARLPAGR